MAGHVGPIVVAVSGGGDSIALMLLLRDHARARNIPPPIVLTVDHGLRKHAAKDAKQVAAWARAAGLKAHVLTWAGAKSGSGVEAAAREARYRLMGDWLAKKKITALYVGHTQDDQAETFLLRLARHLLSPAPISRRRALAGGRLRPDGFASAAEHLPRRAAGASDGAGPALAGRPDE